MMFRARLVCVCLMLGLSGCPQQTRLAGDDAANVDDGRPSVLAQDGADGLNGADGVDGEDGAQGLDGEDGADGADGANGEDGQDGSDGEDGEDGADGADGLSSLVRVRPQEGGASCPAGGTVVESGIDRNRDQVLEDDEVDSSALICNGVDGADATEREEVARHNEGCLLESIDAVLQLACADGVHELETEELTPEVATASSITGGWTPARAAWQDQAGWMSELDSGNPEWLQYDFGAPVVLTRVRALAVKGRHGWNPMIQGSNDGESWTDVHALGQAEPGSAPWTGYLSMDEAISSTTAYRYVRLHTRPVPFVYYAWLGFEGARM